MCVVLYNFLMHYEQLQALGAHYGLQKQAAIKKQAGGGLSLGQLLGAVGLAGTGIGAGVAGLSDNNSVAGEVGGGLGGAVGGLAGSTVGLLPSLIGLGAEHTVRKNLPYYRNNLDAIPLSRIEKFFHKHPKLALAMLPVSGVLGAGAGGYLGGLTGESLAGSDK